MSLKVWVTAGRSRACTKFGTAMATRMAAITASVSAMARDPTCTPDMADLARANLFPKRFSRDDPVLTKRDVVLIMI